MLLYAIIKSFSSPMRSANTSPSQGEGVQIADGKRPSRRMHRQHPDCHD
jgi:hypothetical protein